MVCVQHCLFSVAVGINTEFKGCFLWSCLSDAASFAYLVFLFVLKFAVVMSEPALLQLESERGIEGKNTLQVVSTFVFTKNPSSSDVRVHDTKFRSCRKLCFFAEVPFGCLPPTAYSTIDGCDFWKTILGIPNFPKNGPNMGPDVGQRGPVSALTETR